MAADPEYWARAKARVEAECAAQGISVAPTEEQMLRIARILAEVPAPTEAVS